MIDQILLKEWKGHATSCGWLDAYETIESLLNENEDLKREVQDLKLKLEVSEGERSDWDEWDE